MPRELEAQGPRTPVLRRVTAGLVLVAAAALVIHFAVGLVVAVFWTAVVLVAIVAVLWALKTIL
jgi:hypothetical protein